MLVVVVAGPIVTHVGASAPQPATTELNSATTHAEQPREPTSDHSQQHNSSTGNQTVQMSYIATHWSQIIDPGCGLAPCSFTNSTAVDTQSNTHSFDLFASIGTIGSVAVSGFTQQRSERWTAPADGSVTVSDEYTIAARIHQERKGSGLDGAATRVAVLTRLTVHDRTTNEVVVDRNITEYDLLTPTPRNLVTDTFVTAIDQFLIDSRLVSLLYSQAASQLDRPGHTASFNRTATRNVSYVAQKGHNYTLSHVMLVAGGGVQMFDPLGGIEVDASVNATIHEVSVTDPTPLPPEAIVSVEPTANASMLTGETATYDVVASNVSEGVGTFTVSVSSTNASVTSISNVTLPGTDLDHNVSISTDNTTANVTRFSPNVNTTNGSARLFTVTVDGVQNGTATLEPSVTTLSKPLFTTYAPVATNTTRITVTRPAPPVVATDPPTDPDGDGLLEDVDGDGSGDVFDVLAYYNHRDSDVIRTNPARFDFDGDGAAGTVFDALALYEELT